MARSRCPGRLVGVLRRVVQVLRLPGARPTPSPPNAALRRLRSWSVTSTRGDVHCLLRSSRKNRLAALASPRHWDEDVEDVAVLVDGPPQVMGGGR